MMQPSRLPTIYYRQPCPCSCIFVEDWQRAWKHSRDNDALVQEADVTDEYLAAVTAEEIVERSTNRNAGPRHTRTDVRRATSQFDRTSLLTFAARGVDIASSLLRRAMRSPPRASR
jgi:hypothetical protein